VAGLEARWRRADYPGAARLLKAAPAAVKADPRVELYAARIDYLNGRAATSEKRAAAVATKFAKASRDRVEALDLAGRSAYLRGDYPAAANHARAQCAELVQSGVVLTLDQLDPFCKRAPADFLASFKTARVPQVLTATREVPMQPRRPTVSAVINGRQSAVLVDTGAETSAVLGRDAESIGVRRTGFFTEIQGFTSDRVPVEWGVIATLDLAGWRLKDVPVLVLPDVFPPGALPAPLLLGLNELWPFRTTFDYPAARYRMDRSRGPLAPGRDREVVQVGPAMKVPVKVFGGTVFATLDTGSDRLLLSLERLEQAGATVPEAAGGRSTVTGVSGSLALRDVIVPQATLLGRTFELFPAGLAPQLSEGAGGIFGYDLVRQGRLIVDLQAEGALLESAKQ
jgi:hypothetical protein